MTSHHRNHKATSHSAEPPDPSPLLAVYEGQQCLGHLIARGQSGFEAFNVDDVSLGLFPDQTSAVAAIGGDGQ